MRLPGGPRANTSDQLNGDNRMISFNPYWGGQDYAQDTPPYDGFAITFLPSIVNDAVAGLLQADSEASAMSFMQNQFRASAENMYDSGLVVSSMV